MKIRNLVLGLVACAASLPVLAADIDGRWNATVESPMGAVQLVFEFKAEGERLTGSISADMAGQAMPASPISDGVIKGEDVSFKYAVSMMPDAPPLVIEYKGKLMGDQLNLVSVLDMGQGPQETPLAATRAK